VHSICSDVENDNNPSANVADKATWLQFRPYQLSLGKARRCLFLKSENVLKIQLQCIQNADANIGVTVDRASISAKIYGSRQQAV